MCVLSSRKRKPLQKISLLMHTILSSFYFRFIFCMFPSIEVIQLILPLFFHFLIFLFHIYATNMYKLILIKRNIRYKFCIQISIMLWYSFIFKHLHAEYSLWAWLVSPKYKRTSLSFSFLFFHLFILFFGVKKCEKERKKRRVW